MGKIKITKEQYDRLISKSITESQDVKGGINRVDNSFKKEFKNDKIQNLKEEPFDIKKEIPRIPNSKMKKKTEVNEDIFSPEFHQAIHNFIQNIWLNPSQKDLDKAFVQHGITWGDIITYLTSVGVITGVGAGVYKVNNFFKRIFSKDKKEAMQQKVQDIEKVTKQIEKDPKAPWNQESNPERKHYGATEYNPTRFKPATRTPDSEYDSLKPVSSEIEEDEDWMYQTQYVAEPDSSSQFKAIGMGKELVILQGPDGMYVFDYSNVNREDLPNTNYDLNIDDLTLYINQNLDKISKGEGVDAFNSGIDLVKIDEPLKMELGNLYNKDRKFIELLNRLDEMTSTASSGAFTGLFGGSNTKIDKNFSPAKQIDEMSTAGGDGAPVSTTTGQYVQPAIWAKDEKNWKGNKKTQWAGGSFVELDDCTKLNNNKSAQNGKCSTGAADKVVKLKKTKGNVNAPSLGESIYIEIAKKTGKTVEDVKNIIETKLHKNKPLTKN